MKEPCRQAQLTSSYLLRGLLSIGSFESGLQWSTSDFQVMMYTIGSSCDNKHVLVMWLTGSMVNALMHIGSRRVEAANGRKPETIGG